MNRKSGITILTIAILLGFATWYAVFRYIQQFQEISDKNSRPVVVAVAAIKARSTITPDMVAIKRVSKDNVAAGAIDSLDQAVNKVALEAYRKDEQIRLKDLSTRDKVPGLAYVIPDGKRAVTIKVDEVKGVGRSVHPGDMADILATYRDPVSGQQMTQIILQRLEVLAIDDAQMDTTRTGKGANSSVTFAVTPEEAEKLTVTDMEGALRMMLRPEDDKSVVELKATRLRDLVKPTPVPEDSTLDGRPLPTPTVVGEKEQPKVKVYRGSEPMKEVPVGD